MLRFNKKSFNIIVTVIFISNVEAKFIVVPSDTEAAVGDNATLYCTSSLGSCEWHHLPIGANSHEIVFERGFIYNGYKGRFSVTEKNNTCNLQIGNVSNKDAGMFTCMETSIQATQTTAELIVFEKFPSSKTCAAKITCSAPTCNDLELSCAMQSYGNLRPIMEWSDANGKQMNSTLSEDKTTSTVHLKEVALKTLPYICQVKYPSKSSLSSKYVWSYSVPVYLEQKAPVVASTTEQPEQKKTVPVGAFVAAVVVAIVALAIAIATFLLVHRRREKRKSGMRGNNSDKESLPISAKVKKSLQTDLISSVITTKEKKLVYGENGSSLTRRNGHPGETLLLHTEKDAMHEHDIRLSNAAALVPPFTETRSDAIFGLAILDNEVFIVAKNKSNVDVFDLHSVNYRRQWKVNGLIDPNDMAACPKTERIFICDWKNCVEEEEIFILDKTGMLHYRWRCEGERGRISVTKECLLITDGKKSAVYEYTFNGQLLRSTHLKVSDLMICHAIKIESGNFVACFEDKISKYHEVTLFDSSGGILNSVKNDAAYTSPRAFSTPKSLAVDSKGNIYLASAGVAEPPFSSKIISFSPRLEWKENIANTKTGHNLSGPHRICLCESERSVRLLVADNKNADEELVEGKIRIFNLTL